MTKQQSTDVLVGEDLKFSQIWLIGILVAIVSTPLVVFWKQSAPWFIAVPISIGVLIVLFAELKHQSRLRLKKPMLFTGVTLVVVALHLYLPSYAARKAFLKNSSRAVYDLTLGLVAKWSGQPVSVQAKLNRRITRIQEDFADDPLSILDTLDRGVFTWATTTTGIGNKIHFVIPSTNHFAILTNLGGSFEGGLAEWKLSENSTDPTISALLVNTLALKQMGLSANQEISKPDLLTELLLPFANMFSQPERLARTTSNNPIAPTTKELSAFWDSTVKISSQVQLIRLLGSARSGQRGLFLCSLVDPQSGASVLVLFHTAWKPRSDFALFEGRNVRFDPEDWVTEMEVVMPPDAWDIETAWSRLK